VGICVPARRRRGAGGRWWRREAVASPAGVSCLEVEVDGIYGLASDDLCVCVAFQGEQGPTQVGWSASHPADDPDWERDPVTVSDPLRRGLRTALQPTITLQGTGALARVLNGLLQTPGGVQRLPGRPAAPGDHRPDRARRPGEAAVPGGSGGPHDAPTDGPLDPGSEG
jgi:hypothetical protein